MTLLSVVAPTVIGVRHNPWRSMRDDFPQWRICFAPELPWGAHGITRWQDRTVWLSDGLSQVERRCTLEHERQHIIRGEHSHDDVDEVAVEQATARTLVALDELLDALRWSRHPREVADALCVTLDVLACRWRHMHPAERAMADDVLRQHRVA